MLRQQAFVAFEIAPGLILPSRGRDRRPRDHEAPRLRMRQQDQALAVKVENFRDPAQQTQRWTAAILLQISDMCGLHTKLRGQLALRKLAGRPPLTEQTAERLLAW